MTAFQTSARTRGDGCSVLLTVYRWANHQLDLLNRRPERPHRMHRHPEMSHNYVVLDRLVSNCHVPVTLERDSHNLAVVAEVAYAVGTNDGSATAADTRNGANVAWNCLGTAVQVCTKSVRHCSLPRLFNAASPIASSAVVGNGNEVVAPCNRAKAAFSRGPAMSKSQHGKRVANVQRRIARHLNKGEPVPPGLAQALAALLWKEQRTRLGQLQNMRRRGELR